MTEVTIVDVFKSPFEGKLFAGLKFPKGIKPMPGNKYICDGKIIIIYAISIPRFHDLRQNEEREEQGRFDCLIQYEE